MATETRVAVITGAGSGIGAETARQLAARGWRVVVNYRSNADAAARVVADCKAAGGDAVAVQADVGDDAACRALVQAALGAFGRIDALMNNAGETKAAPAADLDALSGDDFLRLYRNNVVSVYQMTRAAAPALKASGAGSVVNIGSRAGITGGGTSTAYAATKASVHTLTKSLARVLGPEVRVNCVAPGYVDTPWHARGRGAAEAERAKAGMIAKASLKKVANAAEIAEVCVLLLAGATAMTGEVVCVDAGVHLA
ncbi:MAG: SDR family oxidoreductase [Burkholderiales bacterium]|nr:SDR family oxidoreductase [Burkholderiales bacterium]